MSDRFDIPVIVALRGVAALGVVLFHLVVLTTGLVADETIRAVFGFGGLGVNLFFLISGIVIPLFMITVNYDLSMFTRFWARRLVRVEPSYFAALFLGIAYWAARDHFYGSEFTPGLFETVLHFGYLVPFFDDADWVVPVFWTLAIEFQYYLVLALVFPLLNGSVWSRGGAVAVLLSLRLISDNPGFLFYWIPLFLAGILYALYLGKRLPLRELLLWYVVLGAFLFYDNRESFFVALVIIPFIHVYRDLRLPVLTWLGNISYSLYLFHGLSGAVVVNVLSHGLTNPVTKALLIVFGVVVALGFAHVMYVLIERPAHRLAKGISIRPSQGRAPVPSADAASHESLGAGSTGARE